MSLNNKEWPLTTGCHGEGFRFLTHILTSSRNVAVINGGEEPIKSFYPPLLEPQILTEKDKFRLERARVRRLKKQWKRINN